MIRRVISALLVLALLVVFSCETIEKTRLLAGKEGHYTLRLASQKVESWNPLGTLNEAERKVLSLTTTPLYETNAAKNTVEPVLAEGMPEDMTANYAGKKTYGVPEGAASGYAWRITLRKGAVWEDGTSIKAGNISDTLQRILNPDVPCSEAEAYTSGILSIANADAYRKHSLVPVADENKILAQVEGSALYVNLKRPLPALDGVSLEEYYRYYSVDFPWYFADEKGMEFYPELRSRASLGYVKVNERIRELLSILAKHIGFEGENAYQNLCFYQKGKGVSWKKVGIKAKKRRLTLILERPVKAKAVAAALEGLLLVNSKAYEQDRERYATSELTYRSYGPYKITRFTRGRQMIFERNETWFGYQDERYAGQYQTTDIEMNFDMDQEYARKAFEEGRLSATWEAEGDQQLVQENTAYSCYYLVEGDLRELEEREREGENHRILGYRDFREALALLIDRKEYVERFSGGGTELTVLLNDSYRLGFGQKKTYRETAAGKNISIKRGGEPAKTVEPAMTTESAGTSKTTESAGTSKTTEAAGTSKTTEAAGTSKKSEAAGTSKTTESAGTSKTTESAGTSKKSESAKTARRLLTSAYAVCLADGAISDTDQVTLVFSSEVDPEMSGEECAWLQQRMDEAAAGTELEGRIRIRLPEKGEKSDIRRIQWLGDSFQPYLAAGDFCDSENGMLSGLYPSVERLSIKVEGKQSSDTLDGWRKKLGDGTISKAKSKSVILAALEERVLESCVMIPLYTVSTKWVLSEQIEPPAEGTGVLDPRTISYRMDDAAWAKNAMSAETLYWQIRFC